MKKTILFCFVVIISLNALASSKDDISFGGYIRETPVVWKPYSFSGIEKKYQLNNLLNMRNNWRWYISDPLTFGLELKTRFIAGKKAGALQREAEFTALGASLFKWQRDFVDEENVAVYSTVDRAWINWNLGFWEIIAGRQRIAWGTNLVWNPIDIFNPSSPLDFDNEEMPGTDALRLQCYIGTNSKFELAVAPQRDEEATIAAGKLKLNFSDYDWIIIAGRRKVENFVGGAFAGNIYGGGFRGEMIYVTRKTNDVIDNYYSASVSGDYTFRNSLYLHSAILYNDRGTTEKAGGLRLYQAYINGDLTPSKMSLFGQVAGNVTPLVRVDFSGIINPYDKSWYAGPSARWSVMTDIDITLWMMIFGGDKLTEFGDNSNIFMLRLKWSY
ncbi:MAG: hypothetical protein GY855_12380 [candidate division Zixibacteria bacterium]|nr:hypothetical protein [candidate division Zixibacteria bacterium]